MENVQIEVVKVVDKNKTYKAKNGKVYTNVNYYIVFNGTWVAIRPSFKGGYSSLDMISRKIVNGAENEHKE